MDKEKLKKLLQDFGIEYRIEDYDIVIRQGDDKVEGYSCFYTVFSFNAVGKFISVGAYE